jgi:hypothetical protein
MRERETEIGREQKRNEADEMVKKGFENLVGEIKQGHTENYL